MRYFILIMAMLTLLGCDKPSYSSNVHYPLGTRVSCSDFDVMDGVIISMGHNNDGHHIYEVRFFSENNLMGEFRRIGPKEYVGNFHESRLVFYEETLVEEQFGIYTNHDANTVHDIEE